MNHSAEKLLAYLFLSIHLLSLSVKADCSFWYILMFGFREINPLFLIKIHMCMSESEEVRGCPSLRNFCSFIWLTHGSYVGRFLSLYGVMSQYVCADVTCLRHMFAKARRRETTTVGLPLNVSKVTIGDVAFSKCTIIFTKKIQMVKKCCYGINN